MQKSKELKRDKNILILMRVDFCDGPIYTVLVSCHMLYGIAVFDISANEAFYSTAKELIRGLLRTDPDKRLSILQVMQNKWVAVSIIVLHSFII